MVPGSHKALVCWSCGKRISANETKFWDSSRQEYQCADCISRVIAPKRYGKYNGDEIAALVHHDDYVRGVPLTENDYADIEAVSLAVQDSENKELLDDPVYWLARYWLIRRIPALLRQARAQGKS